MMYFYILLNWFLSNFCLKTKYGKSKFNESATVEVVSFSGEGRSRVGAAIKIQCVYRAHLARRDLKALKGVQALVQDSSESTNNFIQNWHPHMPQSCSRPNDMNQSVGERTSSPSNLSDRWMEECTWIDNCLDRWIEECTWIENCLDHLMEECTWIDHQSGSLKHKCADDENSDKILEVDTWKPHQNPRRMGKPFQSSQYFSAWNDSAQGRQPLVTDSRNSARVLNYMANTESDRAKVTSQSASKQRLQFEAASSRHGSSKRRNVPNYMANTESYRAKVRSK